MSEAWPASIGRYRIERVLGRGMMGVVYAAHDPVLGRSLALKTIDLAFDVPDPERRSFEERFLAEARAAARLTHPGIVVVYDVGVDSASGAPFMALELLRGRTLEALVAGGATLEWREAVRIVAGVAAALHHAHGEGIVHRDVKPANIMLLDSGEPKIMDFGIAKLASASLTTGGRVLGSPAYLSPERALNLPADSRSDLFSLGAVLYEVLTGQRAFPGTDLASIVVGVAYEEPPPPSALVSGLPPGLDEVVSRSLAKLPDERYSSGEQLADDLRELLAGRAPRHGRPWPEAAPTTLSSRGSPPAPEAPPAAHQTSPSGTGPTLSLPSGKRVSLAILDGPRRGDVLSLKRPMCLIGRTAGRANADLELPDPEVSRTHALVECHGGRVVVRDLGSTNGTFVGEKRIEERVLEHGDEFRVGGTRIMLIVTDGQ